MHDVMQPIPYSSNSLDTDGVLCVGKVTVLPFFKFRPIKFNLKTMDGVRHWPSIIDDVMQPCTLVLLLRYTPTSVSAGCNHRHVTHASAHGGELWPLWITPSRNCYNCLVYEGDLPLSRRRGRRCVQFCWWRNRFRNRDNLLRPIYQICLYNKSAYRPSAKNIRGTVEGLYLPIMS